jgi:hypothetical protein
MMRILPEDFSAAIAGMLPLLHAAKFKCLKSAACMSASVAKGLAVLACIMHMHVIASSSTLSADQ